MNKVASYLQEHLDGEVLTNAAAIKYYAHDSSVLQVTPTMAVYPRNKGDVRKVARFTWQLAEKGHVLPITPRGRGTDQSGAAIGSGVVMVFPAHMKRLKELDVKQRLVRVQAGMNYRALQETLHTHKLFLPPYPASLDYSTIGGAIANNSAGEKSIKYGATNEWVEQLEVVLADGEIIHTERLSRRDVDRKKGLQTMEGEVYRQVDAILSENRELIDQQAAASRVSKNSSGYNLSDVRGRDGSIDLTPLFIGSQGTLGIVTEAIIRLAPYGGDKVLFVAEYETLEDAHDAISALLPLNPSAVEMVDKHLLEFVNAAQPNQLKGLVSDDLPALVLLVEFDDERDHSRKKAAKKASKILGTTATRVTRSDDEDEQERLWAIRHSAATVINYAQNGKSSLPIIEDGIVPHEAFGQYVDGVYKLLKKHHLDVALWGHAGDANLHMQPMLDLSKLTDRQKVFKLMDEYYDLVLSLGGSIAAEHNDGRLRTPYLEAQHGKDMLDVYRQIKDVFDPYGTLNPGVKFDTISRDLVQMLRREYDLAHLSDHLPGF